MTINARAVAPALTRIQMDMIDNGPEAMDRESLTASLQELLRHGSLTERDEQLLEYLAELSVLSIPQIKRIIWRSAVGDHAVYVRLRKLVKHDLVRTIRSPRNEMAAWGLQDGQVYSLGDVGRFYLNEQVGDVQFWRYLKRRQVLHDLLVSELCALMIEHTVRRGGAWSFRWCGERASGYFEKAGAEAPLIAPDGLGMLIKNPNGVERILPFYVEMDASREAHSRRYHAWGRKVIGYSRMSKLEWRDHPELGDLREFPSVMVITHGDARLLNLAASIIKHRDAPITYYLALWSDVQSCRDIFTDPIWAIIPADEKGLVGRDRQDRQPFLAVEKKQPTDDKR